VNVEVPFLDLEGNWANASMSKTFLFTVVSTYFSSIDPPLPTIVVLRTLASPEVFLCFSTSRFRLVLMYPSPLCSNSLCFGLGPYILVRSAYTVLQQFFFLFRMNAMAHLLQMSSGEAQYPQQYAQFLFNEQRSFSSPQWASK